MDRQEIATLHRETVAVFQTERREPREVIASWRDLLERADLAEGGNTSLLLDIYCQLGLLYLHAEDYGGAVRSFLEAARYFKRVYPLPLANRALAGRLLTNTGIAFAGLTQFAQALAYLRVGEWRSGETEEGAVAHTCIERVRHTCQEQKGELQFETFWQASEPLYHRLFLHSIARLISPEEEQQLFGRPLR